MQHDGLGQSCCQYSFRSCCSGLHGSQPLAARESLFQPMCKHWCCMRLIEKCHSCLDHISPIVWRRLACLLWPLPEALAEKVIQKYTTEDSQRKLRPVDVRSAVLGLAGLRSVVPSELLATARAATCAAVARVAAHARCHAGIISDCVRALGQLRWRLTPKVISALEAWIHRRSQELQPAQLAWMLLGLANSQSPLGAKAMARLLSQVDNKLTLHDGAAVAPPSSKPVLVAVSLHALTELSAQGALIAPATVAGLVRHAALLELKPIQIQQVRAIQRCHSSAVRSAIAAPL
jgi:hypothetical protein